MPINDLKASVERAESRLGAPREARRRPRSDRGASRLDPALGTELARLLDGYDKPVVRDLVERLGAFARERGLRPPARATVYSFMARAPVRRYRVSELPPLVRATLFNLAPDSDVPGDQLAFHCFNYGGTEAMSFAAGLPWRHLHVAWRKRGWRPRSRGLLEAVMRARNL